MYILKIFTKYLKIKELIRMNTQNEYIPVPNNTSLVIRKEHRLSFMKRTGYTVFSITWKAILYAFILTIANVII